MGDMPITSISTRRLQRRSEARILWRACLVMMLLAICGGQTAWAHLGPPYPIMQNRKIGPLTIAVWSNPDVGIGSFFVVIDPGKGNTVPQDMKVQVAVQPVSGRLPEKFYDAWREKVRNEVEFKTTVPFDKEETWRVRILLTSTQVTGETQTNVEVTPPGLGRWDLLLFLLPFLGIGILWFKAAKTKLNRKRSPRLRKPVVG